MLALIDPRVINRATGLSCCPIRLAADAGRAAPQTRQRFDVQYPAEREKTTKSPRPTTGENASVQNSICCFRGMVPRKQIGEAGRGKGANSHGQSLSRIVASKSALGSTEEAGASVSLNAVDR